MRQFLVLLGAVLGLTASTCTAPPPVIIPPRPPLTIHRLLVHVCDGPCTNDEKLPGITIRVADDINNPNHGATAVTDGSGNTPAWVLKQAGFTICAQPDGFAETCLGISLISDQEVSLELTRLVPPSMPVHLDGVRLMRSNGVSWHWRYVTAFDLLARTSDEQTAFLDWVQTTGFDGVRVLTTASITATIPSGGAGLSDLFVRLRSHGLGAELVALADTQAQGMSKDAMRVHVHAVAAAIAANAMDLPITVEIANENAHPSQQPDLQDDAFLLELQGIVHTTVPGVPVSLGSTCCGQPDTLAPYSGGDYITLHLNRDRTPFWDEVRRVKDLIDTQVAIHHLIVDDEPMGADEIDQPGKRSTNPIRFFTQGVLDQLGELGSTFHCSDCITARVPGPIQQQCAREYVAGITIAPDDQRFTFSNDSTGGAATRGANWSYVEKLFTFTNITGGRSFLVALNVTGDYAPVMVNGWSLGAMAASRPGIEIREITR